LCIAQPSKYIVMPDGESFNLQKIQLVLHKNFTLLVLVNHNDKRENEIASVTHGLIKYCYSTATFAVTARVVGTHARQSYTCAQRTEEAARV
jgi:hypothetical protein